MSTTVTGTLSGIGVSPVGYALGDGNLSFIVTGPYVATVWIERSVTPSQLAWERFISTPLVAGDTASYPVFGGQVFRIRTTTYTSGTVNYTFTPPSRAIPGGVAPPVDWANLPSSPIGLAAGLPYWNGNVLCLA